MQRSLINRWAFGFALANTLFGCAHRQVASAPPAEVSPIQGVGAAGGEAEIKALEKDMQGQATVSEESKKLPETGMVTAEVLKNPSVQNWIRFFSKADKQRFQRHLDRAEPYRPVVQEILVKNGIPADIFYLGIVESGYVTSAKSTANAVGVWQFIAPTGKRYGLEVNGWVDERRDIIRATEAAAKYLKDLHNVFNSWELALAAYNTGEGRVMRAILKGKSRDFWTLLNKGVLPNETEDYVPKFVAAAYIYENAEKFGLDIAEDEQHPHFAVVDLPPRVKLADLARVSGINPAQFLEINPHLLRGVTPPNGRTYSVWVPRKLQKTVIEAIAGLPRGASSLVSAQPLGFSPQLVGIQSPTRNATYISNRAARSTASARVSSRKDSSRDPFSAPSVRVTQTNSLKTIRLSSSHKSATRSIYVKRGESLEVIARNHGTSVEEIRRSNGLVSSKIIPGQELQVPVTRGFSPAATAKASSKIVKYRVQAGDSLASIADRFGISIEKIKKDNRLRRQTVFAGEVIKVEARGI